jgi:hypothetical protein
MNIEELDKSDSKNCPWCAAPTISSEVEITSEIITQLRSVEKNAQYDPPQDGLLCFVCGGIYYPLGIYMRSRAYLIGHLDLEKLKKSGIKNVPIEPKLKLKQLKK